MQLRILRKLPLRQRVFGFIGVLGLIPMAGLAAAVYSSAERGFAEEELAAANAGAFHLAEMNAAIYAIVMESRGIYMSPSWDVAKPFAAKLEQQLQVLSREAEAWKAEPELRQQESRRRVCKRSTRPCATWTT
jgi:methyl-accepting chemotaxis protein